MKTETGVKKQRPYMVILHFQAEKPGGNVRFHHRGTHAKDL